MGSSGGQVVLAGDPKQLGPVLRSSDSIKFGLGISLLERLMEKRDIYQPGDHLILILLSRDECWIVESKQFIKFRIAIVANDFKSHYKNEQNNP